MNDSISRQAAIDAIDTLKRNYPSSCFEDLCKAVDIAIKALSAQLEVIRCNECKYYQGVHGVMGHAPCSYWNSGGVMWDWCCSQGEKYGRSD